MATTKTRRCIGSARFGIEQHEAPLQAFPRQPSQPDGLGRMCAVHWKTYVKGLNADRKARVAAGEPAAKVEPKGATKRERRQAPMASKPAPKPESPRVRKARATLAATETLGGTAYTEAFGSPEVQDALETINGSRHDDEPEEVARVALEQDPRSEDEIRAQEARAEEDGAA